MEEAVVVGSSAWEGGSRRWVDGGRGVLEGAWVGLVVLVALEWVGVVWF